jgi:glycine/D-amino acid oxidase-like deaminating enzyme
LGEFPETRNLFIACGHYRNGILLAPATARILADKIVNNADSEFLKSFGLERFYNSLKHRTGC